MATTYRISRWSKGTDGADVWTPVKTGLTKERAEQIVEAAKWDLRYALRLLRVEAEEVAPVETPAPAPQPAPVKRPTLTAAELQDARTARALRDMADYTLRAHDGSWIVTSPAGSGYIVTATTCSCGDWEHRCSKVGALCKHQVFAAQTLFAEGVLLEADTPGPAGPQDLARPVRFDHEAIATY